MVSFRSAVVVLIMAAFVALVADLTRSAFRRLFPEKSPYGLPLPKVKHQTLTEEQLQGRKLMIIGDIHGCYDELVLLLDKCNGRDPDTLVLCVGDIVNKGPGSLQVVRLMRKIGAFCVRGNHDEICLGEWQRSRESGLPLRDKFKWMERLSSEELEWLLELPYTISIPSKNMLIVHAGLVPGVPIEGQSTNDLIHIHDLIMDEATSKWKGLKKKGPSSVPWASKWPGPTHVYFGHDAKRLYQDYKYATGLDTGCVYGLKLTAVFPCEGGRLVEVEAIGTPRDKPELTEISET